MSVDELIQSDEILKHLFEKYHGRDCFAVYLCQIILQAWKKPSTASLDLNLTSLDYVLQQLKNGSSHYAAELENHLNYILHHTEALCNLTVTIEPIFSTMWYSKLPCYDLRDITSDEDGEKSILKSCSWKGEDVPCSSIFKKVATDKGICCAFNNKAADEILLPSKYSSLLKKFENEDTLAAFNQSQVTIDLSPSSGINAIFLHAASKYRSKESILLYQVSGQDNYELKWFFKRLHETFS